MGLDLSGERLENLGPGLQGPLRGEHLKTTIHGSGKRRCSGLRPTPDLAVWRGGAEVRDPTPQGGGGGEGTGSGSPLHADLRSLPYSSRGIGKQGLQCQGKSWDPGSRDPESGGRGSRAVASGTRVHGPQRGAGEPGAGGVAGRPRRWCWTPLPRPAPGGDGYLENLLLWEQGDLEKGEEKGKGAGDAKSEPPQASVVMATPSILSRAGRVGSL